MSTNINEQRVDFTTNNLCKMQYFSLFDRIDIVLDPCPNKNKQIIEGSLTTHSYLYRAISALFFSF